MKKNNKLIQGGFIKKNDLLLENCRVDDLLNISDKIKQFQKKILAINSPTIIGLVGPFGVGKSTMLFQVEKKLNNKSKWINFDAWKYPDRRDLWEGFILDFADQVGEEKKKILKKVDGKSSKSKWVDLVTDIASGISEVIPDEINFLDKFVKIFQKSPATRIFQLQDILKNIIKHVGKNVYVVIEDIDRSGDKGIFFLETLKQFMLNLESANKFIVIVPMSNVNYQDKFDSYLKAVDYFEFFRINNIKLDKFVDDVFNNELFRGQFNREFNRESNNKLIWTGKFVRTQVISFLEGLFKEFPEMSMRLLKLILRKANMAYINQLEDGHNPDFRVTICIEASKYFSISKDSDKKYFDNFKDEKKVIRGNIFSSFLVTIFYNKDNIYINKLTGGGDYRNMLISSPSDFYFIERKDKDINKWPSYPWSWNDFDTNDTKFGITSFYLEY